MFDVDLFQLWVLSVSLSRSTQGSADPYSWPLVLTLTADPQKWTDRAKPWGSGSAKDRVSGGGGRGKKKPCEKIETRKNLRKYFTPRGLVLPHRSRFWWRFFRVSNKGRKYLFSKTFFFFRICLDFNIRFYFSCIIVFGLHYIAYSQHSILRSCFEHQFL